MRVLPSSMWSLYFPGCSGPVYPWTPALILAVALHPAVAPCCVPQAGAPHVHEVRASSAAAGLQCSRLHDIKAEGKATTSPIH